MGRVTERRMGMGRCALHGRRRSSRWILRGGGDRNAGGASAALAVPSVSSTGPVLGDAELTMRAEPESRALFQPDAHRALALVETAAVRGKFAGFAQSAVAGHVHEETAGRPAL